MTLVPALIDVLAPDPCPACGGPRGLAARTRLCFACDAQVHGLPVALPPLAPLACVWALGPYDGPLGAMIRRAKYAPDPGAIDELARRLAQAANGRLPQVDLVTSVPVPWSRRLRRGFDQAERLAIPVAIAASARRKRLLRRVRSEEQAGRGLAARRAGAHGAFAARQALRGQRVLLVDDVLTTGSTVSACATELLGAGASRVYGLIVAHQPPPRARAADGSAAFFAGSGKASQVLYSGADPAVE